MFIKFKVPITISTNHNILFLFLYYFIYQKMIKYYEKVISHNLISLT